MKRFIVPTLGALALATAAFAGPGMRLHFEDLDADGNGAITAEEAAAGAQARAAKRFERLDSNKDGVVTQAEVEAARAERPCHDRRGDSF